MSQGYPQGYPVQGYPIQGPIQPGYPHPYSVPTQPYYPQYGQPQVVPSTTYYDPYSHSFRECLRRFFGFAPRDGIRYTTDRDTWGFMGYSRRQRYIDARTGQEVDRKGRPVYRI